jgi:hypothetical protein
MGRPRHVCYVTLFVGRVVRSEPRGAELLQVQVNGSRRVFGPLTLVAHRAILALAGKGKAGHNGCDGHQTDT